MNRDAFEQLVNAWLAEPDCADLRERVDAAIQAEPELARLLDDWRRFDQLLRRGCPPPRGVDWPRLKARVLAAAVPNARGQDEVLDAALCEMPSVGDRVHWSRFHTRVMAALTRSRVGWASRPPEVASRPPEAVPRRRRYTRVVAGAATLLAAAAALLLAVLPHATPVVSSTGLVRVRLSAPLADGAGIAYAHIAGAPAAATLPEQFFAVDPMPKTGPSDEAAGYY